MKRQTMILAVAALAVSAMAFEASAILVRGYGMLTSADNKTGTFAVSMIKTLNGTASTLRGSAVFRMETREPRGYLELSARPHGEGQPLQGTLSGDGKVATFEGPATFHRHAGKNDQTLPGTLHLVMSDRRDEHGKGDPDHVLMSFAPGQGDGNFSFEGNLSHGDLKVFVRNLTAP